MTSLRQCHPSLCRHLGQPEPPKESSQPGNLYLLSLSMVATENLSPILLTIISSYLSSALTILTSIISRPQSALPRPAKAQTPWVSFVDTLTNHHTLIDWMPSLAPLTQKHLDPILTRAYSLLTKTTSTLAPSSDAEARALYLIRIYGLFCLAYTSKGIIEKPDTFWAQASKFSHTYVKTCSSSSEVTISTVVGQSFSKLVGYAKARDDPQFLSGKGFVRFCENWTGFASKVFFFSLPVIQRANESSWEMLPSWTKSWCSCQADRYLLYREVKYRKAIQGQLFQKMKVSERLLN